MRKQMLTQWDIHDRMSKAYGRGIPNEPLGREAESLGKWFAPVVHGTS